MSIGKKRKGRKSSSAGQTCSEEVPDGRVSTLGGQVGDKANEGADGAVLHRWPEFSYKSGRLIPCQAISPHKKLLPLKCIGWEFQQNPEFNHLVLTLKPGTARTAEKWLNYYCRLGRAVDVVIETAKFSVQLHRPLCTYGDKHNLEFHYLPGRPLALTKTRRRTDCGY
jgi:hypothetical protein